MMIDNKTLTCPYCQKTMDIDKHTISKDMILNRTASVITASCMYCLIEVVIQENLHKKDLFLLDRITLLEKILETIPKDGQPAFLTARKDEIKKQIEFLDESAVDELHELQKVISFIDKCINEAPWGEY